LVNMMVARRVVPGLSWRPCFSPVHIRTMVGFSKYVIISNTSVRVFHSVDKILLGYFLPASSVAFYAVPYSLGQRLGNLAGNITSTVFPAASALMARAGDVRLSELYLRGTKSVAACVCFPALAICLLSREILTHWIDPDFARHATVPLQILTVGFLMNCLSYMPYVVIQATGQPEIAARFTSFNAGLSIALFLCLIPSFGTVGAAVGFLFSQLVCIPWFIHRINGELGIKWLEFSRGLNSVLLASGLGCLLLTLLRPWIVSLWSLGMTISVALVAYAILVALFVLDSKERATCLAVMDQALPFGLRRIGVRWAGHKP
jgi:O-antigen/teichoic acid export membrane protein